jgi:hypothetical protein
MMQTQILGSNNISASLVDAPPTRGVIVARTMKPLKKSLNITLVGRTKTMTLYEAAKAHGEYISNHESDLYLEVNEFTRTLLAQFPLQWANATRFRNQVTGKECFDIPFAYDPWWIQRTR